MKFQDIKQFPNIHYRVNMPLTFIPKRIKEWVGKGLGNNLQLNPDFQEVMYGQKINK